MPPTNSGRDDLVGTTIAGRYRIISQLGEGGMGVAYRAWDVERGIPVVVSSRDAKQFVGVIGGDFDRYAGFESVGGRHFHNGGNESSVRGSAASVGRNGVEHSVTVQVRKTKVTLLRDNEVVSELETDFRNLDFIEPLTSRRHDTLGVGWYEMKGRITAVEINEISGAGRLLE